MKPTVCRQCERPMNGPGRWDRKADASNPNVCAECGKQYEVSEHGNAEMCRRCHTKETGDEE